MGNISRAAIENAFQPSKEADNPDRFAGRKIYIEQAYDALLSSGSNIAIFGNRGIGKTSLAKQIEKIGQGKNTLLSKLKLETNNRLNYLTCYLACGDRIQTFEDILLQLMTHNSCLGSWIPEFEESRKELEKISPKLGVSFAQISGEKATESTYKKVPLETKIETVFTNTVRTITTKTEVDGILFILDEYDQVKKPKGFASFLKSAATNIPNAKFVIVGVAQDLQKLIREHESADRLFASGIITLPKMTAAELFLIIDIAEATIKNEITFDNHARFKLAELAQGHPYFVHLIGKYALKDAFKTNKKSITRTDIQNTVNSIAEKRIEPTLESLYRTAIGSSPQRESVLRIFAEIQSNDTEVHTKKAYEAAYDSGIENPSQYVKHLTSPACGSVLEQTRDRYYRIKDSLFAAYINARPRLH